MDYGIHKSFICQWNAFIRTIYVTNYNSGINKDSAALFTHVMFVDHVHVFLCHANLNIWL